MIHITSKEQCVGCNACVQRCPKACIIMEEDHEGFLYPKVDQTICIDCSICEKVCPVIHQAEPPKDEPATYACYNKNEEVRRQSSSGGIFTLLAEAVLAKNGVVFGARFDENFDVIHDYTESVEGLKAFRGSKYVQSRIGETYLQAERFLKDGREVLFSGTPCQIAGFKRFLRKEYTNLLAVDFICHGVPSPKVWRMYKQSLLDKVDRSSASATFKPIFTDIQFRDKTEGWKKYSFAATISVADQNTVLQREPFMNNAFMKGFLQDLYLRPSCYACPAKQFKSQSDLTIADYWGIQHVHPEIDDDKGVSLVFANKENGSNLLYTLQGKIELIQSTYICAIKYNPSVYKSVAYKNKSNQFYSQVTSCNINVIIESLTKISKKQYIKQNIYRYLKLLGIIQLIKAIKQ